jgi:hypothetical protein
MNGSFELLKRIQERKPIVVLNNTAGALSFQIDRGPQSVQTVLAGHSLNLSSRFKPEQLRNATQLKQMLDTGDLRLKD